MMSIDILLQAAEYLDRRDREAEHGYAAVSDLPRNVTKKPKTKKSQGSRTTHNELEKNRRAHLRHCLEKLKELVPLGPEASRHTTLGLLTKAERYIKNLEDRLRRQSLFLEQARRENRYLKRKVKNLEALLKRRSVFKCSTSSSTCTTSTQTSPGKRRTVSECSTNTVCSVSTNMSTGTPSVSESDEVDVIGYTSNQSDTDDYSSVQSSSDSGVAMSTSRLTLAEMDII